MSPHGARDWGDRAPIDTVFHVQDLAELAARLGSIDSFDRRGNVIYMDDFEGILRNNWSCTEVGGSTISLASDRTCSGNQSVKLYSPAGGSNYCILMKYFPLPTKSRIAIEWKMWQVTRVGWFRAYIYTYDGSNLAHCAVQLDPTSGLWQVYNESGGWEVISSMPPEAGNILRWDNYKLVVDYTTDKYVRFIVNGHVADLSSYAQRKHSGYTSQYIDVRFTSWGGSAAEQVRYMEDFILTQNED
jgi:hypothetical protein